MKLLCECNSYDCQKTIDLSFEEAKKIKAIPNSFIIVNGCQTEPTDILVSKESGYSIYKEGAGRG